MSLIAAVRSCYFEDVKRLVDSKANPNEREKEFKRSPLHIAAQIGSLDICNYLLRARKIDVNLLDGQGWSPLLTAIIEGHYDICESILSYKSINPSLGNNENNTPLIYLCKSRKHQDNTKKYRTVLSLLLTKGVDVNQRNDFGEAALHYAVMAKNLEAMDILFENGCNVNIINKYVYLHLLIIIIPNIMFNPFYNL